MHHASPSRHAHLLHRATHRLVVAGAFATILVALGTPAGALASSGLAVPDLDASPIRVVDLRCEPGQTDLNHASRAELTRALGISEPIAQRVADTRPYYAVDDLLAVEGIGDGRLRHLDRDAICATPITIDGLVPAIPDHACAPDQTDAAKADRTTLSAKSGLALPGPVADRLIARREVHPFPSLEHLAIVEGVGEGRLKQWAKDGGICLTPAPFIAISPAGDLYKGALLSRSEGERVALDAPAGTFALGVPAGVLDVAHAWATVIDVPDAEHRGPRADFKVHGPWQGAGDRVFLTVPADPFDSSESPMLPAVALAPGSSDIELHVRSALAASDGSWTIASEHLTEAEASRQFAFVLFFLPTDRGGFGDQVEAWGRENLTGLTASAPSCRPDITNHETIDVTTRPASLMTSDSALGRPIFLRCVQGRVGDPRVEFSFANASALAFEIPRDEAFPHVDLTGSTFKGDVLSQALFAIQTTLGPAPGYQTSPFVLPPTATVRGSLGFIGSYTHYVSYDPINTSGYWSARTMSAVLGTKAATALAKLNCFAAIAWENVSLRSLVSCARGVGVEAAKAIGRVFVFLDSGHTLKDAMAALKARLGWGGPIDGDWHFHRHHAPTAPPPGGGHGSGTNPAGGPDGTIVVDGGIGIPHDVTGHGTHSGTVYVAVDDSGVAYGMNLADAGDYDTYDCFGRRYPMRSYLPLSKLEAYGHRQESIYPAECNDAVPVRHVAANATNFILREKTGTAWFIDADSNLHWIADGGTFICLAQRYYVLDHTPWPEISQFEDDAYAGDAACA